MYFGTKSYLKSNRYHTAKHALNRVIYPKTNQYSPIFTFPNTFIHEAYGTLCASNSLATEAFASLSQSIPRLLDAPCLESKQAKMVSWGARHSAILTEDGQVFSWGWYKHGQVLLLCVS
ncbi:hypothetical protein NC651_015631 [Populus alba x Populus x berolinensis]|nr:hypothetical protein NC651_015631 [Populus alba x Populus x berolinensis]